MRVLFVVPEAEYRNLVEDLPECATRPKQVDPAMDSISSNLPQ
jgi:hypothetical protein